MERIEATCSCGASLKVESNYGSTVHERFAEWQDVHKEHAALLAAKAPTDGTPFWEVIPSPRYGSVTVTEDTLWETPA